MTARFFVPGYGTDPAQLGPNAALKPYGILPAVQPESVLLQVVLEVSERLARVDSNHHRRFQRPVSCH